MIKDSGDRTEFKSGAVKWQSLEILLGKNWRYIKDSDGYFIVDDGSVLSAGSGKVLKPIEDKYGYLVVNIYDKTRNMKTRKVHRLVAEAFIPNPKNHTQINHKDENKKNNFVCNLEWCNAEYNNLYGKKDNRKKVYEYDMDGNYLKEYESVKKAADEIGSHVNTVRNVCSGKGKTLFGKMYKWYKEESIPPLSEKERKYAKRYMKGRVEND